MTGQEGAAYATDEMKRAGVGFREHTGWATMVALGGGVTTPVVLARNRYGLSEGDLPRAVYHAARQLDLENAERLVREVELVARTAAERQLRRTVAELEAGGYEVVGTAVAAPRELPAHLSEILGSHPLVHTAEGQLYREALAEATGLLGLPLTRFVQQELFEEAAVNIGTSDASLAVAARPEGSGGRRVARACELRSATEPGARTSGLAAPHAVAWWWPT
jgi:hypothetical protein